MARSDYWIKIFDSLPGHWKVRHLQRAMDWSRFETVGFLVMFWLQVASDAPDGVLNKLVSANDILKAIGLKDKTKKVKDQFAKVLQAMMEARLLEWECVDDVEVEPAYVLHDWEDGGGKLQKSRIDDTLRQRGHRSQKKGDPAKECHATVTHESKSKEKETPPNPPQAGGDFKFFENLAFSIWQEECAKVGREAGRDNATTRGAASVARQLMSGELAEDAYRRGLRKFLSILTSDATKATWNLGTFAKNPFSYISMEGAASSGVASGVRMAMWDMRCSTCGYTHITKIPADCGPPISEPCGKSILGRSCCDGEMIATERVDNG